MAHNLEDVSLSLGVLDEVLGDELFLIEHLHGVLILGVLLLDEIDLSEGSLSEHFYDFEVVRT